MSVNNPQIILIDDDKYIRHSITQLMELEDIAMTAYADAVSALEQLQQDKPGVIISDIKMPGMDGMQLLNRVQEIDSAIPVILITGHGDIATAVQAMRDGAYDFLEKPFSNDKLLDVTRRAIDKRLLTLENRQLKRELELHKTPGRRIIGKSAAIRQLRTQVTRFAAVDADILLLGETGAGKDLVARTIHELSQRSNKPYVAINCGAIPEQTIESELFGHDPGAFTGASQKRVGRFEFANGGTVFLDEIESMPLQLQVKLLRVLQERVVEPLGSNRQIALDIRVIAATKVELTQAIAEATFRADLYYRLNVITIQIPALRDYLEDLPLLFHHYALLAADRYNCEAPQPSAEQLQQLLSHTWPGNVRELKNAADRFVLLAGDSSSLALQPANAASNPGSSLPEQVERFERSMIEQALIRNNGVINATMEELGLARKTLYDKMRKYHLDKEQYK